MEQPPDPPQNAVEALAYALDHPDAFEGWQIQQLQQIAQDSIAINLPVQYPVWFMPIWENNEMPEDDFEDDLWQPEDDWQPPQQEDPEGVVQSPPHAVAGGDPEEEEENPRQFRGQGKRMVRMPYDEFVKEHKHLLDVLSKGDRKTLREEYESQKAELGRHGRM